MLNTFPLVLLLLRAGLGLATALTETHKEGYCSFYGSCGLNPEISSNTSNPSIPGIPISPVEVPCLSNTPAFLVSGSHLDDLKSICPSLFTGDNSTYACCSQQQLKSMKESLGISQVVLSRCPSCSENFANIYCQNICSPNQSVFTNVTRFFNRTNDLGKEEVGVLEYQCYYKQSFADQAFDSCKGVRVPSTGGYAIGLMCGKYGATLCNSKRWLDYQGDTSNGLAPLKISFQLTTDGTAIGDIRPLNETAWKCSEPVRGSGEKCSCSDCMDSCPAILLPPAAPSFEMGRMHGILFMCLFLLCFLLLLFVSFLVVQNCSICVWQKAKPPKEVTTRLSCSQKLSLAMHKSLTRAFSRWGAMMASYPITVILISAVVVAVLSSGIVFIQLTTNPVELWSAPDSQARQEKDFYDQHFGPFFRTNQVILTAKNRPDYIYDSVILGKNNFSGILSKDILLELLELQTRLRDTEIWSEKHGRNVSLKEVCFAPLNPQNSSLSDCCVNSLMQYFQNDATLIEKEANQTMNGQTGTVDWRDHFLYCTKSPVSFQDITEMKMSCMADYGAPVFPFLAVGGYPDETYSEGQALLITFLLNNYPVNDSRYDIAMLWEKQFLKILKEFQEKNADNFTIAYMAERSLEDEINRTTWEDLPIFTISYLLIFVYITLALGEYSSCRRILVDSKMTLGLGGILVVVWAVLSSIGFYSYVGLPSSLIIIEVVPFLVLAVGADNIFIFVLEYQNSEQQPGESREQHIGRVLGSVGPSMLLCSLSEVICFFLGALTPMPAVRTFALNAALAVLFDFLLQMSMFVALMSLDARRQKASRLDLCCCVQLEEKGTVKRREGLLYTFMRRFYAPVLLNAVVRALVILIFILLFCAGIYLMFNVEVGLEQELAVPKDSYMVQYFQYLNQYFMVGVPTYFVTTGGYNFSTVPGMNGVCSSTGCDSNSMVQKIQYATEFPEESFLAIPASSWLDDFIDWLKSSGCCRFIGANALQGEFCPSTSTNPNCSSKTCVAPSFKPLRPNVAEFNKFLPWFLHDPPIIQCPKGGLGSYDTAVKFGSDGQIIASRFMAYHKPLKNSQEYTAALKAVRKLAANITASMQQVPGTDPDFQVFPYTVTYVFYEQYLTIVVNGFVSLALCLIPTFVVCCILLGMDLRSGVINLLTIIMILVDTVGAMTLWGVAYNAISLINLVAAVGISVEFVSHITRSFAMSIKPTKVERAKEATVNMGSAVFAGVAMTNLPGIVVLAFAKAQLIQIFFFRLNLIITLLGMLHGLIFLPVFLSYFGPDVSPAWVQADQHQKESKLTGPIPEPDCKQLPSYGELCRVHEQPPTLGSDSKGNHEALTPSSSTDSRTKQTAF